MSSLSRLDHHLLNTRSTELPATVLAFLTTRPVTKVTWAAFGAHRESWYFAFEMTNGMSAFLVGACIPAALQHFLDRIRLFPEMTSALRVQLGSNNSFIAWAKTSWACSGVPMALELTLCELSSAYMRAHITQGSLKGSLSQVAWNSHGSYHIKTQQAHRWHFESKVTRDAWAMLWPGQTATPSTDELSELVVRVIARHEVKTV